jgi:hypothetical protein
MATNGAAAGWHPSRTPDHQAIARRAIAETGMRSVIIPFSAIGGSGLELDSVRPVHVREDARWDETVKRIGSRTSHNGAGPLE